MEQLKELVNIANKQTVKNISVMTNFNKKGKLKDLYEGVSSGKFDSDEEALKALYPDAGNLAEDSYRKLKKRLIDQLVNAVLFIGTNSEFKKGQQLLFQTLKHSVAAKIIRFRSGYRLSESLAKQTLKKAIAIEQSSIALEMVELLRGLMSRKGDKKEFEKYNELFVQYNELVQAEYLAKGYLDHIILMLSRSGAVDKLIPLLKEYEANLKKVNLEKTSSSFLAFSYLVYVNRCEVENDQKGLQQNCEEIIKILEERGSMNRTFVFVFLFKSLDTYRRFQQFEKGKLALQKALDFTSGLKSANWLLVKSAYIRLCFFCNKMNEGYAEYLNIASSGILKKHNPIEQEAWEVYNGYFVWLSRIGEIETTEKSVTSFRLGKFINMVPTQAKDKEGYNATVLVLQLLFLIQMRDYDALIDKTESLKAYSHRYLRKKQMFRTRWFVKMLLLIPLNYFNKTAIKRKAIPLHEKMSSMPVSERFIISNMEIVPYELLWKMVLGILDNSFTKRRNKKGS